MYTITKTRNQAGKKTLKSNSLEECIGIQNAMLFSQKYTPPHCMCNVIMVGNAKRQTNKKQNEASLFSIYSFSYIISLRSQLSNAVVFTFQIIRGTVKESKKLITLQCFSTKNFSFTLLRMVLTTI